ncbi:MAG: CBS domain-containing protein [Pseudomonadota bacterium]
MIQRSISEALAGKTVTRLTPEMSVRDACHMLELQNAGAAVVVQDGRLVGIFSERDVIRKCVCMARRTDDTTVSEIMTPDPVCIALTGTMADALRIMLDGGFRHLPVLNDSHVVGLLSMRDIPTENRLLVERFREYTQEPIVA